MIYLYFYTILDLLPSITGKGSNDSSTHRNNRAKIGPNKQQDFVIARKMTLHPRSASKRYIRTLLVLTALLLTSAFSTAWSQSVSIDPQLESLSLADHVLLLQDDSTTLTFAEVSSAEMASRFDQDFPADLDFGYTDTALWFKLELDWDAALIDDGTPYLLEIGPPKPTNDVFVWLLDESGDVQESMHMHNNQTEHHPREVRTLPGGFVVRLEPGVDSTVYIRATSFRNFHVPLTLWSETAFKRNEAQGILIMGLFYGTIGIMILYNLFLYLTVRDRNYLYYVAYASAVLLVYLGINGHMVFLDLNDNYVMRHLSGASVALLSLTRLQFTRSFLDIDSYNRMLGRIFAVLIPIAAVLLLLAVIPEDFGLFQGSSLIFSFFAIAAIIYAMVDGVVRGHALAKLYLLVTLIGEVGVIVGFATLVLGLLPHNWFTDNALFLGLMAETVLFSFALAWRVRLLEGEKQQALREKARLESEIQQFQQAEQQLKQSQNRLHQILEHSDLSLVALNEAGYITFASHGFCSLLGLNKTDLQEAEFVTLLADSSGEEQLMLGNLTGQDDDSDLAMTIDNLALQGRDAEIVVRGQLAQIGVEDAFYLLVLNDPRHEEGSGDPLLAFRMMAQARDRLGSVSKQLQSLEPLLIDAAPQARQELQEVFEKLNSLTGNGTDSPTSHSLKSRLIETMRLAVECWEMYTGKTKVELAQESKLWAIVIDNGRLRTRTLDRYLGEESFPKRPRWRQVARTGYFVLAAIKDKQNLPAETREALKYSLLELQALTSGERN